MAQTLHMHAEMAPCGFGVQVDASNAQLLVMCVAAEAPVMPDGDDGAVFGDGVAAAC